jgi:hypothetical protein
VTLDDGSKWTIRAGSNTLVAAWNEAQRIVVKQDVSGNHTLQNLDTTPKEEVRVTRRR